MSAAMVVPAFAQTTHPAGRTATGLATIAPPTPDADELADQMRALAKNPKDVGALIRAGELTLLLGDPTAAAVLFSRAEKIAPDNARMKAGMARSEEHTSELQSLMRISYAVFCLKKKT